MLLTRHRNEHQLFIRHADATSVTVIDRLFRQSFVMNAAQVVEEFAPTRVGEIDEAAVDRIFELQPEVVLLGTGDRADFPAPSLLAQFLERGVGVETMDNAAAARTFNVLVSEGRNAVAVFLLRAEAEAEG
jgi:uncharacterized protein